MLSNMKRLLVSPLRALTSRVVLVALRRTAVGGAVALCALCASAQSARDIRGPTPLIAIPNEAPVKLIVDPPIPEQLALGRVVIQYRAENLRIVPVFGKGALSVSPRVGHLHYTADDASWPIVDTSGETVVLVGLKPGPHRVLFVPLTCPHLCYQPDVRKALRVAGEKRT